MRLVAFTEAPADLEDAEDADLAGLTGALAAAGAHVHCVAPEAEHEPGTPLLDGLARQDPPAAGILLGAIPSERRYRDLEEEAAARGVRMLDSPGQHLDALLLSRGVERLAELTARTRVISEPAQLDAALDEIGLPVFLKGDVFSRKWHGWDACVAQTRERARAICEALFKVSRFSREKVLVRELLPLRRAGDSYEGFPLAREYRLFCLDGEPMALGYYWPFDDPFGPLAGEDLAAVERLGRQAFARLGVTWLAVDVGQLEGGAWRIVETGDPQCSGLGHIEPRALARRLVDAVARRPR